MIFMVAFGYLLLDLLISAMLFVNAQDERDKYYLENYPLAVRAIFSQNTSPPTENYTSKFSLDSFEHFSLLGFFKPEYIAIVKNGIKIVTLQDVERFRLEISKHRSKGGKILVALGGSTTATAQMSNWPTPLERRISSDDYLVINAGHNGFTSFQERILLFEILFPLMNPNLPDIVISLTGVNDISRAASSVLQRETYRKGAQLSPAIIHDAYVLNDLKNDSQQSLLGQVKGKVLNSRMLSKILPSVSAFLSQKPHSIPAPLFKSLGSKDGKNMFKLCDLYVSVPQSAGSFTPDQIAEKSDFNFLIHDNFKDLLHSTNPLQQESIDLQLNECQKKRNHALAAKKTASLSQAEKASIINELLMNHLETYSALTAYNIKYLSFLQPISSAGIFSIKDIPNYDYNLIHWYMRDDGNGFDYIFEGRKFFDLIRKKILETPYKNFFYNIPFSEENEVKRDGFTSDNIHYKEWFSGYIADEIYKVSRAEILSDSKVVNHLLPFEQGGTQTFCNLNLASHIGKVNFGNESGHVSDFYNAIDGNIDTFWETTSALPITINLENGDGKTGINIKEIGFRAGFAGSDSIGRMPESWSLQASNDRMNWTELLSIEEQKLSVEGELKKYQVSSDKSYLFMKITVSDLAQSNILRVSDLSIKGCISIQNPTNF
tara:strand:+ start:9751 stop:11730 length:1980 start_codon:yes stop_codon:yes gene_type:complete